MNVVVTSEALAGKVIYDDGTTS